MPNKWDTYIIDEDLEKETSKWDKYITGETLKKKDSAELGADVGESALPSTDISKEKSEVTSKELTPETEEQGFGKEMWGALKSSSIRAAGGVVGIPNLIQSTVFELIDKPIYKRRGATDEEIKLLREFSKAMPTPGTISALESKELQGKLNKAATGIESTMKQYEEGIVGSISNGDYGDATRQLTKGVVQSLPYLAMVGATSGGGTPAVLTTLGSVSASQRLGEIEEMGLMSDEDTKKIANAWLYGGFEAVGELFTAGIFNNMRHALRGASKEILGKESKKIALGFAKEFFGEGVSEGFVTELGQQLTDYFSGGRESIDFKQI